MYYNKYFHVKTIKYQLTINKKITKYFHKIVYKKYVSVTKCLYICNMQCNHGLVLGKKYSYAVVSVLVECF